MGKTISRSVKEFTQKLLLTLAMCVSFAAFAQQRVTGIVVDAQGEPIIGANVVQKGQPTNGVVTDVDGKFSLQVPTGATLEVSYVGYTGQTVKAAKTPMRITLSEDAEQLEEMVVVGYGTMKRTDLTGASVNVRSDAITANVGQSAIASLQGKSAGLSVFTTSVPGSVPVMRVRGSGSINASNNPLLVVDGFPLDDSNLNDINPNDIESMEVLKDASSTAIYGSRGANGVIMITTKKGSGGRKNISVNANYGIQMRSRLVDLISGDDYVALTGTENKNPGGGYTDWQRAIISKTAPTQDYNVTLDGSSNGTDYMLSAGYYNQQGLLRNQGYEKFTVHNNLQHKFNHVFTIGSSMQMTTGNTNSMTSPLNEIFRSGYPTEPIYNEDGSYNIISGATIFSPLADMDAKTNKSNILRFLGDFFVEVHLLKNLTYKFNVGYDTRWKRNYAFNSSQTAQRIATGATNSDGSHGWSRYRSKLMDNILTYQDQWGKHRLTATAVYSWQDFKNESISVSANTFDNDLLGAWSISGHELNSWSSGINSNRLISFTTRASYNYDDRYLLTATVRWDGSSRFGADSKWGTFPSVGLAWRPTQEAFLKDNSVLTDLKIRASYGITGNQEIGNYKSLSQLSSSTGTAYSNGYNSLTGYSETLGNKKLKWERTTQVDAGFDMQLWGRLNINADYYQRNTNDLLYNVPIPSDSGYSNILDNIGKVQNRGIELTVGGTIFKNRDWNIGASANFTWNTNEIKELYNDVERVQLSSDAIAQILQVGYPVNSAWGRNSLGIIKDEETLAWYKEYAPKAAANAQLGDEMYEDLNGDGSISIDDFVCLGSVEPKYYYGFNLNVAYRKFKIDAYGQGAFKYAVGYAMSEVGGSAMEYLFTADNCISGNNYIPSAKAYSEMWSEKNPNGDRPRRGFMGYPSSRSNKDWWYFVLRNVQFSYDFSSLIPVKGIKSLALTVNLQNFFTTSYTNGYDPYDGNTTNPWAKTILFGANVKF